MAKYYQKPRKTGNEYVLRTRDFLDYTINMATRLPSNFKPYLLDPLVETANEIEKLVNKANGVYINNEMDPEKLLDAYYKRDDYLRQALELFKVYDQKFERLMRNIRLEDAEFERINVIIRDVIRSQIAVDPETSHITIDYKRKINEIEYTAGNGNRVFKLLLTKRHKDNWLRFEMEAKEEISARLRYDGGNIAAAKKRLSDRQV